MFNSSRNGFDLAAAAVNLTGVLVVVRESGAAPRPLGPAMNEGYTLSCPAGAGVSSACTVEAAEVACPPHKAWTIIQKTWP